MQPNCLNRSVTSYWVSVAAFAALVGATCSQTFGMGAIYEAEELKFRAPSIGGQSPVRGYWVNWEDVFFYTGDAQAFNQFIDAYSRLKHRKLEVVVHRGPRAAAAPWKEFDIAADWSLYVWNTGVPLLAKVRTAESGDEEVEFQPVGEPAPTRVDIWVGPRLKLQDLHIPVALKVIAAKDAAADAEIQAFVTKRAAPAAAQGEISPRSLERPFRLTIELSDGSRVRGRAPAMNDLALQTSFGRVAIPPNQIECVEFPVTEGAASVRFRNGDRLTGILHGSDWQEVKVLTLFGELTIPVRLIKQCMVEGPLQCAQVSVRASSSWETSVPEKAFDGSHDTDWNSGTYAPAWIEADLSAPAKLAGVVLTSVQDIAGATTHEIWISDEPIGDDRSKARLAHTFHGQTSDHQPLKFDFPKEQVARYVQIRTTESPTWIAWWDVEILVEKGR